MSAGLLPIMPGAGPDVAPPPPQGDAPDPSSSEDFASVLALAWAQPGVAPVTDVPSPSAAGTVLPGTAVTPASGSTDDAGATVGLYPATTIPSTSDPVLGPLPDATIVDPNARLHPAGIDTGVGTPTKPIDDGGKGIKAVLGGTVDVALVDQAKLVKVTTSDSKIGPVRHELPASTPTKPHSAHGDEAARLGRLEASARLAPADGSNARREPAPEATASESGHDAAHAGSVARHEGAGHEASSGGGDGSGGQHADERANVVDRRSEIRAAAKSAADAQAVADMIAGPRKAGASINASSLKSLFDARGNDREVAAQKVEAAAADGTSLVAGESKTVLPGALAVAPHAVRTTVSQSFETVLGEAERLGKHETKHLDLHLTPDELGDVDVRISKDADGRLSAMLVADRESARHALAGGMDALRQSLERAGVSVDRLDVGVNSNGGSAAGSSAGGQGGGSGRESYGGPDTDFLRGADSGAGADDDRLLSIRA